jgi:hypothetical protein
MQYEASLRSVEDRGPAFRKKIGLLIRFCAHKIIQTE